MTDATISGLTRHFCTLGSRQVHYRRMGNGPALIALHKLPRSSKSLVPFMQQAAHYFTIIAPDIAGYGNSWPLSQSSSAEIPAFKNYVDDLEEFITALGLKRCALYGEGEGAAIALQLAASTPAKHACVALNHLPSLTQEEAKLARYSIPQFEPKWDGSHLAWLWAFLREENCFSPWWVKRASARILDDMPSPHQLHERVNEFLAGRDQGRNYHKGIIAALDANSQPQLSKVTIPKLVIGGPDLNTAQATSRALEFLLANINSADAAPPPPAAKPIPDALWDDFVSVPGGQLHMQRNHDVDTMSLLVQHDAASSVGTVEPITRTFVGKRSVLAFDMPGSGESDNIIGYDNIDVQHYAQVLNSALDALGLDQVDFYGMWGGGFVGLELALLHPKRVRCLVMSNVFEHNGEEQRQIQNNYTPAIEPVWHGGHLMQCWHQMRDQGIYYPWFDRTAKGVIKREPFLDTNMVHERVCSLLKAGNMYRTAYQSHFRYPTYAKLKASPVPTLIATTTWDPNNPHTQQAAQAAPNATFQYLDDDFTKWGESFLPFLTAADH